MVGILLCGVPHRPAVCGDRSSIHGGHWAWASGESMQVLQEKHKHSSPGKKQSVFLLKWEQGIPGALEARPGEVIIWQKGIFQGEGLDRWGRQPAPQPGPKAQGAALSHAIQSLLCVSL